MAKARGKQPAVPTSSEPLPDLESDVQTHINDGEIVTLPKTAEVDPMVALEKMRRESNARLLRDQLTAPFGSVQVKWKIADLREKAVDGSGIAIAVPVLDCRTIMDRLDEVFGVAGWNVEFKAFNGLVVCRISAMHDGTYVFKESVEPSGHAAFEAAAIMFGIGRYLGRVIPVAVRCQWQKEQLLEKPELPPGAVPKHDDKKAAVYWGHKDEPISIPYDPPKPAPASNAGVSPPPAPPVAPPPAKKKEEGLQEPDDKVPDKKVEAANAKRAEEFKQARLNFWLRELDKCEGPPEITELIANNLPDESIQTKAIVWHEIQQYIVRCGYKWSPQTKECYKPDEDNVTYSDAIPF